MERTVNFTPKGNTLAVRPDDNRTLRWVLRTDLRGHHKCYVLNAGVALTDPPPRVTSAVRVGKSEQCENRRLGCSGRQLAGVGYERAGLLWKRLLTCQMRRAGMPNNVSRILFASDRAMATSLPSPSS